MKNFKISALVICSILPFMIHPFLAAAATGDLVDLQSRVKMMVISYVVNDDFSIDKTTELEIQALSDNAAKSIKRQTYSYSTSVEKFDIVEAYTKKPDGNIIKVPKDNYQVTVNKGNGNDNPVFSDRTKVVVIFPDFEINDSAYLKIQSSETEPMFPNNFSVSHTFWSQVAYDDVKISVSLPEAMKIGFQARGMTENNRVENGRRMIELTYRLKQPVKIDREDFSVLDEEKEAGFAISTFTDYEEIGRAYGARANPKAIPTERIKSLARDIVGEVTERREKARILYDWVASNITYGGNCIGVGTVVPHDTDFILNNRMGDCKDHATLLESLYSATGIESTSALINADNRYTLPTVPLVSAINHVITYIPEWNQFVDSTNPAYPFDLLAFQLMDKPVILADKFKADMKTPAFRFGDNVQELVSTMDIQPDGSVKGDIQIKMKGRPAIETRAAWRHATKTQEEDWLKNTFSSENKIGVATMTKDDPTPLLSTYNYSFQFDKPEFILSSGVNGFYIWPLVNTSMSIASIVNYSPEEILGYSVACGNGTSVEKIAYTFPEGLKILAKPENFEIEENHLHFTASYEMTGNTLIASRKMEDQTPGNVCSSELINRQRQTLMKISNNLRSQVIYQH